jgi:hypothetical protein
LHETSGNGDGGQGDAEVDREQAGERLDRRDAHGDQREDHDTVEERNGVRAQHARQRECGRAEQQAIQIVGRLDLRRFCDATSRAGEQADDAFDDRDGFSADHDPSGAGGRRRRRARA